jgi:dGTPase
MVEDVIGVAQATFKTSSRNRPTMCVLRGGRWRISPKSSLRPTGDIKAFLYRHLYRHPDVMRVRASATLIVRDLFSAFMADPSAMGEKHRHAGIEDLPVASVRARFATISRG